MFDKVFKIIIIIGAILGAVAFILQFTNKKSCKESLIRREYLDVPSQTPSVSMIITTYPPHLKYLGGLIKNIENCTMIPDEIIISASETTHKKLSKFIPKNRLNLHLIPTKLKQSAAQNRNRAIKVAKSDYIMLHDGDDFIHNRKVEILKQIFKQNPNIQLLLHNYDKFQTDWDYTKKLIFNKNDPKSQIKQIHEKEPNHTNLKGKFKLAHGPSTFKRSIWQTIKYSEDIWPGEDGTFCQNVLDKFGNVYAINLSLIGYRH